MRTTIEVFGIQIKKRGELLDFGEDPDFFDILSSKDCGFVHHVDMNKTGDIPVLQRTVRIPAEEINAEGETVKYHHRNVAERYICGIIETGAYGKEYEIADKDSPNDVAYKVDKDQAIIKPFFYFLKIPRRGSKALLILERTDNEGIFPLMAILLKTFINNYYGIDKGYSIEKTNIILSSYLEELNAGRYNSVTLTASKESSDTANRYFGNLDRADYTMELVVKFKNNLGQDKENDIKRMINSKDVLFESSELNDIFDNANRKVTTTIGTGKQAKTRTLYLNSVQQDLIRPYYDLIVDTNAKGFSSYASIKEKAKAFIKEHTEFSIFS